MTEMRIVDPGLPEDPLDSELIRLVRALGHFPPFTDQEIELASRKLESEGLSSCLSPLLCPAPDPFTMEWKTLRAIRHQERPAEEVADWLARAARDGGEMTPEVEERMRDDRANAERNQND